MKVNFLFKSNRILTIVTVLLLLMFSGSFSHQSAQTRRLRKKDMRVKKLIQPLTLDKAHQLVVKQLYKGELGKRAIFGHPEFKKKGVRIASWRSPNKITINKDSWFFFVDEQPGANWEHKASYIVVDRASGEMKKIAAMTPPVEVMRMKGLNSKAISQMGVMKRNLLRVQPRLVAKAVRLIKRIKYAVLVCGGWNAGSNYGRYWNDLQFMYKALKNKYKYSDDEIIVLYANGTHSPNGDFDGNGSNDIDYAATKANLTTVFNSVASTIAANGKFFFYATNHGGDDAGAHKSNLTLWGESIKDYEFGALSKKISCKQAVYVFEQCFSGGMMDDILKAQTYPCTKPSVVIMTAAREDEVSWSCDTEGAYDEYIYHWTSAVFGKTPTGAPVNADTNHDGKVSMKEAHEYAKMKDSRDEHPMIGSCVTGASDVTL